MTVASRSLFPDVVGSSDSIIYTEFRHQLPVGSADSQDPESMMFSGSHAPSDPTINACVATS